MAARKTDASGYRRTTMYAAVGVAYFLSRLAAQVTPAPGWCSMAHCNPQMSDFVQQTPPGTDGNVYIKSSDPWNTGVSTGDGCISNGTYAACAYKQSWNALVVYDGNGNTVWGSGDLLDNQEFAGLPIMQADGSVVAADDQHIYKFNSDGSVAWSYPTPGGVPIGLVPTPNGAIVAGTAGRTLDQCWQDNCTLSFTINNGGTGYTSATVILAGGLCPGATATATISGGAVSNIVATSQGSSCIVAPDVVIVGDGTGASATGILSAAAPVSVYSGLTGALVGSTYLYQTGDSGPYYQTANTSCVNNGSYPNRVYLLAALSSDRTQAALLALDIDPTNLSSPVSPAWNVVFHGPSGASPLCAGNQIYFDGAGIAPGGPTQTAVFGVQDNGSSGSFLFQVLLPPSSKNITCNFALDPRPVGGFWHQVKDDPNIYHRAFNTGALIEKIDVGSLLIANGAPTATYWQAGIFTTYGTPAKPYFMLPEATTTSSSGYFVMLDIAAQRIVWAVPMTGNDPDPYDTPGGDAVLLEDSNRNPVMLMTGKQTGAYFITEGGPILSSSIPSLSFGTQMAGSASGPQSFALFSTASGVANIAGIAASGPFSETNTCGATLAPGNSCTVTVTFSPTSAGLQSGSITVTGNTQNSPLTVRLAGFGTASTPIASLSANQLNFPAQAAGTTSRPQTVTLTNTGTAALSIASITVSGAVAQTDNCPTELAPGAGCTLNVMLAAPLTGACNGNVTLATNAPGGPQTISGSSTCTPPPAVESSLSTTSLVFAPQTMGTVSPSQTVTLLNIGTQVLNIASIIANGDVTETNTCGRTLAVGAKCALTVSFAPAAIGVSSGTVTVTDAAPDSPHIVMVSGVGLANPVPLVNQPLLPSAVLPGTAGLTLTVNGTAFVTGSVVYWNGTPRVTTYISGAQISAALTATDLVAPSSGSVSVVNPSPGGGQSNAVWMPVGFPSPAPVLTGTAQPTGTGPAALTAADFNTDGKLDLAIANSGANTVSILLGNGDGTFAPRADYATGMQPVAVAAADLNHDGILDLVVVNQADNTVSVLLGGAGGVLGLQTPYATGNGPVAVALADLNADGNLDLAVANQADNTVSILFGNGDGTFAAHLDYAAGPSPAALVAGDFNADGKLDLAVANDFPNGTITVLLNHGDGSYVPGVSYATGDSESLAALDVNGDGKLDLTAVNELEQTLSVYTGNGDGTFRLGPYQSTQLNRNPLALAVADVNNDGTLELLMAGNSTNGFTTLENNNEGVFTVLSEFGTGTGVAAMAAGDFNNDGSIDVALAVPASNQFLLLSQAPSADLSSTSLNFGSVVTGGSGTQTLTLTNGGSAVLKVSAVSAGNHGTFSQTNNCAGVAVAPGDSCTITAKFSPTATGTLTGNLNIQDNAPGGSQKAGLSGVGATFTASITLAQNPVVGGNSTATNTVVLSSPAPAGGWAVRLSSSNTAVASVPASVPVAAGATVSSAFTITTTGVSGSTPVTLMASVNGANATVVLTVNPIAVAFTLAAPSVFGGVVLSSNTLTLALPAPAGGLVFNLSSSNPSLASVPASVSVAAGATVSSSFAISSAVVASQTTVTLFASLTGVSGSVADAILAVNPAVPSSVVLSQTSVVSGLSTAGNLVNLTAMAPSGGITVSLSSSKPSVAAVPSSVAVAANSTVSAPFTITAGYVTANTQATITASYLGKNVTANLMVTPDGVASVNLSASSVVGGAGALTQNTVTLLSSAPSANATVTLTSSNPSVASAPSSVTVTAGATVSAAFQIATTPVSATTPVTITATYNGIAATATLMVDPPAPSTVTLTQTGVIGGKTVGGSVTLNAPAPVGGLTVSLSSSNPSVATPPVSVQVAAGATTSPNFKIATNPVSSQTVVTISATYLGNSAFANLTVAP